MEKAKLFLSYGRHDAEHVAVKLKQDLEAAGYEVWMDRSEIKAGTAWINEISSGLSESQAVVALLSPHAVRVAGIGGSTNDSVCLDEIAFAREFPGKILPVMVADCSVPLILYRLDYVDLRSWHKSDSEYKNGVRRILEGIEAALRNEIRYRNWNSRLQPMDFTPFLEERRRGFVGRHWLFEEVLHWLEGNHQEPSLLIVGDPGIGKSAFVGQWVHLNPNGRLLAYHCCQIDSPSTLLPSSFIRSIAAMIASQIPEYEAMLGDTNIAEVLREDVCGNDPLRAFDEGILAPLHRLNMPNDTLRCILIDALDEAILLKTKPGEHNIVTVIADRLSRMPHWLRVVATTRGEKPVLKALERLRPKFLQAIDPRNMNDARNYLVARFSDEQLLALVKTSGTTLDAAVELILERSKGNFLYMHYVLEGLSVGNYHLDRPDEFPPGLHGFYEKAFEHRFIGQEYEPAAGVLAAVLAAREPLDLDLIFAASGLSSRRELNKILNKLAVYLPERNGTYSVFHRSFAEWLRDSKNNEEYCIEPVQGEKKLADIGWNEYEQKRSNLSPYMLRNLPYHLTSTGQWEKLTTLLVDLDILDAVWKNGREHEWMRHWRLLMDRVDMVSAYQRSIDRLLDEGSNQRNIALITGKVGALLRNLGLHGKALPFAEKALKLLRELNDQDETALASALLDLAETHRHLRQFDKALPLYEESLRIRERHPGPNSAEVGDVLYALCVFHNTCDNRDVDKAILCNNRAIHIRERLVPLNYAALADCVNDEGVLLSAKGEFGKELPCYEKARDLFEQGYPNGHPELGVVLSNIGRCLLRQDQPERALEYLIKGLEMRSLFVVPYDDHCQSIRRSIMECYIKLQKKQEVFKWADEVVTLSKSEQQYSTKQKIEDLQALIYASIHIDDASTRDQTISELVREIVKSARTLGEDRWNDVAVILSFIVRTEIVRSRFESSMMILKRGLDLMSSVYPKPLRALALYHRNLAEIFNELNEADFEKQLLQKAQSYDLTADKRAPYYTMLNEADKLIDQNELVKAKDTLGEVYSSAFKGEMDDPEWNSILSNNANNYAVKMKNEKNEYDLAEWFYDQGIALNPENDNLIANYAFFLTSVCGKHEQAEKYYQRSLNINPNNANCLSNYAVFQTHVKGDFATAEKLFDQANSLKSPHGDAILGNYAALRIILGDLDGARKLARQSYEECSKNPDRLMARPLFCAAAIAKLQKQEWQTYLSQLKSLLLSGIHRVPWQATALINSLREKLPRDEFNLLETLWRAICSRDAESELERYEDWAQLRPLPLDKPWP